MDRLMKAALKKADGTFEVTQVAKLKIPAEDWVLARVTYSGICGTDLRHWHKQDPDLECRIMGHELAAEVVEIGSKVTNVKVGDRVVVETLLGDDTCEWCRIQQYNLCPNLYKIRMETISRAFAEYVTGPENKFHLLPPHISDIEATLLDTFSVCLHAQQLSGLRINHQVLIIGAGPIGLGQLQLAKASGADVIIADVVDSSLQLARSLGASATINTLYDDLAFRVNELTNGRGCDITFECVGGDRMADTLPRAVSATRIGGKIIIVGGFEDGNLSVVLPWQEMQKSEIQLILSASYSFWDIDPIIKICIDLLAKGKLNAKKMITHTFKLDEINEAFEVAQNKEESGAVFVALKHV